MGDTGPTYDVITRGTSVTEPSRMLPGDKLFSMQAKDLLLSYYYNDQLSSLRQTKTSVFLNSLIFHREHRVWITGSGI